MAQQAGAEQRFHPNHVMQLLARKREGLGTTLRVDLCDRIERAPVDPLFVVEGIEKHGVRRNRAMACWRRSTY